MLWCEDLLRPDAAGWGAVGITRNGAVKHVHEGAPHIEQRCDALAFAYKRAQVANADDVAHGYLVGEGGDFFETARKNRSEDTTIVDRVG